MKIGNLFISGFLLVLFATCYLAAWTLLQEKINKPVSSRTPASFYTQSATFLIHKTLR